MIEAYGKNILLKAIFKERASTILMLQEEKPIYYEIQSAGKEIINAQMGDKVLVKGYGMQQIEHEGEKYFLTDESAIIAKVL
jgi:co-chaperonin GroES (HSP10)